MTVATNFKIKTEISVPFGILMKNIVNKMMSSCVFAKKGYNILQTKYDTWLNNSLPDRLSNEELQRYASGTPWDIYEKDRADRKSGFVARPIERTFQGMSFPIIRGAFDSDASIKTFLEVGAYYGYALSVLAKEYPTIKIHGIDLPDCMQRINEEFMEPNLSFSSGYALDELESGNLKADMFYFISTATRFKNLELKRYFNAIKKYGKYIILNEMLIPLPDGMIVDPLTVPTSSSVPVIYKNSDPSYPPQFIHNYKNIAEECGFEVLHYHVHMPKWTDIYRIEMLARVSD